VDLLDEIAVGVGDQEPDAGVGPNQGPDGMGRELLGAVVGMALPAILESHRQHQRQRRFGASGGQLQHRAAGRIGPVERRIAPDRGSSPLPGLGQHVFPVGQPGMDRRDRPEPRVMLDRGIEQWIAFGGIPPEHCREVGEPGLFNPDPVHGRQQRLGRAARGVAEGVAAQKGVDVNPHGGDHRQVQE
jgi:hypothetical protein